MNMYIREMKGNLKSFGIWMLCILGVLVLFLSMYPSFSAQGAEVNKLLEQFPPEMMQIFSLENIDFSKIIDYYAYTFQYLLLAALLQFILLGANLLSREEDSGTINFLYAKPVSRSDILRAKFLAGLSYIGIFFVLYSLVSLGLLAFLGKSGFDLAAALLLSLAIALGQFLMLCLGLLLGQYLRKARTVLSASLGLVMALYFLSMVINLQKDLEVLKFLSPFQYFDARLITESHALDPLYVGILLGFSLISLVSSFIIYQKRDIPC